MKLIDLKENSTVEKKIQHSQLRPIKELKNEQFANNKMLKKIVFDNLIEEIPYQCFKNSGIEEVALPEHCNIISDEAFNDCINLNNIDFNNNVTYIGEYAFAKTNITELKLPDSLLTINKGAFFQSKNLKEVEFGENILKIQNFAFYETKIEKLKLPASLTSIYEHSFDFANIKELIIPLNILNLQTIKTLFFENCNLFIYDKYLKILVCDNKFNYMKNSFPIISTSPIKTFLQTQDKKFENLINHLNSLNIIVPFSFIQKLTEKELNNLNFDKFKRVHNFLLKENYLEEDINAFFVFCYNLGAFSSNENTRLNVCNFLKDKLTRKDININEMHYKFNLMNCFGEKEGFTDFYINNYLEFKNEKYDFLAMCYNSFEKVQALNTSNKGNQRQKQANIKFFKTYLNLFENFKYENESEKNLSIELSKFYYNQCTFDNAKKILNSFKEKNINTSIIKNKHNIKDMQNEKFSFEWLEKNDPKNFTLGKYCNCCAHLEGVGYSIMKASILLPEMQNLVIKKNNTIIAKSTIYINKNKGYGIYNNFEIAQNITEKEKIEIFKVYKRATIQFINAYNKENKIKINKVNVGLHFNDLFLQLSKDKDVLPFINLKDFPLDGFSDYKSDAMRSEGQACIFDINNK